MQLMEVWEQPTATTDNSKGNERSQCFQQKVWRSYEQVVMQTSEQRSEQKVTELNQTKNGRQKKKTGNMADAKPD